MTFIFVSAFNTMLKNNKSKYFQVLSTFVWNCLSTATELEYTSIIFPLLGTGHLNIPSCFSYHILQSVTEKFDKETPETSIEKVLFHVQPQEGETVSDQKLLSRRVCVQY